MALTSLAWLQEPITRQWRLFSGGLDGSLTEWHIPGRRPKQRTDALGGAVWAMSARPPSGGILVNLSIAICLLPSSVLLAGKRCQICYQKQNMPRSLFLAPQSQIICQGLKYPQISTHSGKDFREGQAISISCAHYSPLLSRTSCMCKGA